MPVDDVFVTVASRPRPHGGHIRPGFRLGNGEPAHEFSGQCGLRPFRALSIGSGQQEGGDAEPLEGPDRVCERRCGGDDLARQTALPQVLLPDGGEDARFAHQGQQRAGFDSPGVIVLGRRAIDQIPRGERRHGGAPRVMLRFQEGSDGMGIGHTTSSRWTLHSGPRGGRLEVSDSSAGAAYRKRGARFSTKAS